MLGAEVAGAITAWQPRQLSVEVARFARQSVVAAEPPSRARARALLFAAAKLGAFCSSIGLELDPAVCLFSSVIERFIVCAELGDATRRTVRSNLRLLAHAAVSHPPPAPVPLSRERAKAPYEAAEIAAYLALADAQPTALRRRRTSALLCLGAGAGLMGGELGHVRGTDIVRRSGGVLVLVEGRRPRAVPVLRPYHERLLDAAGYFGEHYLVCGNDPDRHNVTTPLISSLSGGVDLARLDTGRLRATFLVACAEAIGLRVFMDAAGITCSQRLGDLVGNLEPGSETDAVALFGRAR